MAISQVEQIPVGELRLNPAKVRKHSRKQIAAQLAEDYAAPVETIQTDVMEFVQSLTDIRLLRLSAE